MATSTHQTTLPTTAEADSVSPAIVQELNDINRSSARNKGGRVRNDRTWGEKLFAGLSKK